MVEIVIPFDDGIVINAITAVNASSKHCGVCVGQHCAFAQRSCHVALTPLWMKVLSWQPTAYYQETHSDAHPALLLSGLGKYISTRAVRTLELGFGKFESLCTSLNSGW